MESREKTPPLDRALTKRKRDKQRRILDLLEERVSGRRGQTLTKIETARASEGWCYVVSVLPWGLRCLLKSPEKNRSNNTEDASVWSALNRSDWPEIFLPDVKCVYESMPLERSYRYLIIIEHKQRKIALFEPFYYMPFFTTQTLISTVQSCGSFIVLNSVLLLHKSLTEPFGDITLSYCA